MLRLLTYLLNKGIVTNKTVPDSLPDDVTGLPTITDAACQTECRACIETCPTMAISVRETDGINLDRGACIGCRGCIDVCPTGTLVNDGSVQTWSYLRESLFITRAKLRSVKPDASSGTFGKSLAVRVVSTGCSACDLELSAANNPIFDAERFGISVVASPRFADALLITGPVPKSMHEALKSCYEAMAAPRVVIACGTCAISGGVHVGGYADSNGVAAVLPVDVYIPGCAPHPWQIIAGLQAAQRISASR